MPRTHWPPSSPIAAGARGPKMAPTSRAISYFLSSRSRPSESNGGKRRHRSKHKPQASPLVLLLALAYCQRVHGQLQLQPANAAGPQTAPLVLRPQPLPPPVASAPQVMVPGSPVTRDELVTEVILPYENFQPNSSLADPMAIANVIDHKRYVEAVSSRCFSSTVLEDPMIFEPNFVIIKPSGETRVNATAPPEAILAAGFEPRGKGTTIFVHGFTQSYPSTDWLRRTRALFEKHALVSRHNLIIMDWGTSSHGSYAQVAARVSAMASFLANFLMKLTDQLGAERQSIHLIGHSLGAHLSGFAGKRMRPRIGRITALDPAGPCFGKFFSNSPMDRLSADDAFEVDVYHYDDGFLGLPGQIGQFDVYVNGGSSQPGCKDNIYSMFNAIVTVVFRRNRVLSESHTRSTEVATSQLSLNGCQQLAYECRDFQAFMQGECGRCDEQNAQCFFMGFPYQYAEPEAFTFPLKSAFPPKRYYILTGLGELYCANHYQLLVKFEPTPEMASQARRNKWRLQVELVGDADGRLNVTITNLMAPNIFSYLLLTEAKPMRLVAAHVRVLAGDNSPVELAPAGAGSALKPSSGVRISSMEVNFMSHVNPVARRAMSSRLCPSWGPPAGVQSLDSMNAIADSGAEATGQLLAECMTSNK